MIGFKVLLVAKGLKLIHLSRELDIPYPTMLSWSNGISNPPDEALEKIAHRLGVGKHDLYQPPLRRGVFGYGSREVVV